MNTIKTIGFVVTVLAAAACSGAETGTKGDGVEPTSLASESAARPAAQAAMGTLRGLVQSGGDPARRGFGSNGDIDAAQLESGLPMEDILPAELRSYRLGGDVGSVVKGEPAVLFPVTVHGEVRSSIVLRDIGGEWQPVIFGMASVARNAFAARRELEAAAGHVLTDVALVEIQGRGIRMLGYTSGGLRMFKLLGDVHGTDLRAGEVRPAGDVLMQLASIEQ